MVIFKVTDENSRIRIRIESGSVSQMYGSADPDPYQNVTEPQHCFKRLWIDMIDVRVILDQI